MKSFLKRLYGHKLLIAALMTGLTFAVLLFFSDFKLIYSTNDDYMMSLLIQAGDDRNIFMNFFLTYLNVLIQRLLPYVNWFVLLQVINSFLAVCTINYVLMKKNEGFEGWFFSLVFDAVTVTSVMITVQWTQTTSMMCAAGFMLLYYALTEEKRKGVRIFQIAAAFFFTVYGSLYRLVAFEMCVIIFCLFMLCCIICRISMTLRIEKGFWKSFAGALKKYLKIILCSVLIVVLALGAEVCSDFIKNTDPAYQDYVAFNNARSAVNDFNIIPYRDAEAFYQSIGIDSADELEIVIGLFTDKDFYDTDKLNTIANYSVENGKGRSSALTLAVRFIKNEIRKRLPAENKLTTLLILGAAGLLGLFVCILLFYFRDKLKWLFPLLLLGVWIVFLKYYGFKFPTLLYLPLGVFIFSTVFIFNRYHFLFCAVMSAATMALFFYQNFSRMRFRVSYTFLLPALVFLLLMYNRDNMRLRFRGQRVYLKALYLTVVSACCIIVSIHCNVKEFLSNADHVNIGFDRQVQDYVNEHPDEVFAHPYSLYSVLDDSFFNPLMVSQFPENTIPFGDWHMASAFYDKKLSDNGVTRLFEEMKDSDSIRVMITLKSYYDYPQMYEIYLNRNYAEEGETIRLVQEAYFEPQYNRKNESYEKNIGIYKVITE